MQQRRQSSSGGGAPRERAAATARSGTAREREAGAAGWRDANFPVCSSCLWSLLRCCMVRGGGQRAQIADRLLRAARDGCSACTVLSTAFAVCSAPHAGAWQLFLMRCWQPEVDSLRGTDTVRRRLQRSAVAAACCLLPAAPSLLPRCSLPAASSASVDKQSTAVNGSRQDTDCRERGCLLLVLAVRGRPPPITHRCWFGCLSDARHAHLGIGVPRFQEDEWWSVRTCFCSVRGGVSALCADRPASPLLVLHAAQQRKDVFAARLDHERRPHSPPNHTQPPPPPPPTGFSLHTHKPGLG